MHRKSTLERPDKDFISLANTIETQCTEHAEEWRLDTERLRTLNMLTSIANIAYEKNSNRAIRNLITVNHKRAAFSELRNFLSPFINYLLGNLSVPDEALAVMNLRPRRRKARHPRPRPQEIPLIKVEQRHNELKIYVNRPELGHPIQSSGRENYAGFKLRWRFDNEVTDHIEMSTRLYHTLFFNREDETKRVILAAAWMNHRLEEGPWSEDITEIVS
jgi:hypothetical protein